MSLFKIIIKNIFKGFHLLTNFDGKTMLTHFDMDQTKKKP